jgi:hypothetical protein
MKEKDPRVEVAVLQTQFGHIADELSDIKSIIKNELIREINETKQEVGQVRGQVNQLKWWRNAVVSTSAFLWSAAVLLTPYISQIVADKVTKQIDSAVEEKIQVAVDEALKQYVFEVVE